MSVQQYLRKASLIVGDNSGQQGAAIDLSELRFAFAVRRGDTQTPNSADIRVYNLSDNTAKRIMQLQPTPEFTRVVVQAGYGGNFGVIFDGSIVQIRHGRESATDTYLDITAADGDSAYNFSVTALSLAAGATPVGTIKSLIAGMVKNGVATGYIPDNLPGNPAPRGQVFYGMTRDHLRVCAKDTQTAWSIQDGKLIFVPLTAYMPGETPIINRVTGMVGLPEQTQNGIKIKTLLNPNLKIGQKVLLDNASIQKYRYSVNPVDVNNYNAEIFNKTNDDGEYYVMQANHNGDTRGNDWYTDLTCLAINADVPLNSAQKGGVAPAVIKRWG